MILKQIIRTRMLEICIETSVSLTRYTCLELIVDDEKGNLVAHCHSILAR
jgi:hypothetical protein